MDSPPSSHAHTLDIVEKYTRIVCGCCRYLRCIGTLTVSAVVVSTVQYIRVSDGI